MDIPCVLWYNGSRIETHRETRRHTVSHYRKQVILRNGTETRTITFTFDNSVTCKSSDINRGQWSENFDSFDEAHDRFLRTIGALYLDGYR